MEGTNFRFRYEAVDRDPSLQTALGRGRLLLLHLLQAAALSLALAAVRRLGLYPPNTYLGRDGGNNISQ